MKTIGLYFDFPFSTTITREGLGRVAGYMLKTAAEGVPNVKFVIACPRGMQKNIPLLEKEFNFDSKKLDILTSKKIFILEYVLSCIFMMFSVFLMISIAFLKVLKRIFHIYKKYRNNFDCKNVSESQKRRVVDPYWLYVIKRLSCMSINDVHSKIIGTFIQKKEKIYLINIINLRQDIDFWFSPCVFWKEFTLINKIKICCVPDIFPYLLPIPFSIEKAALWGERVARDVIKKCDYFITYSNFVKYYALVEGFSIDPHKIFPVPLAAFCGASGFSPQKEKRENIRKYICSIIKNKARFPNNLNLIDLDRPYIFYATQIRPNKNIFQLIKAFAYLVHENKTVCNLILTASYFDSVKRIIYENNIEDRIIIAPNLSSYELDAFYFCAEIAIAPTLTEGGAFPATLPEALAMETPAIISRIPIVTDALTFPEKYNYMLFDPYDWEDIAEKIQWGVQNREKLLNVQRPLFREIMVRSWKDVINDYIDVFNYIYKIKNMEQL